MNSNDPQISTDVVGESKPRRERPPTSFYFFVVINVFGACVASYGAWSLDSSVARSGDAGPGGGLVVLLLISFPVMACLLANTIALAMAIVATIKRPRFAPAGRFAAILLPWLFAVALGSLSH